MKLIDNEKAQDLIRRREALKRDLEAAKTASLSIMIHNELTELEPSQGSLRRGAHLGPEWREAKICREPIYYDDARISSAIRSAVTGDLQSRIYDLDSKLRALGVDTYS